jgi:hypothetical protein
VSPKRCRRNSCREPEGIRRGAIHRALPRVPPRVGGRGLKESCETASAMCPHEKDGSRGLKEGSETAFSERPEDEERGPHDMAGTWLWCLSAEKRGESCGLVIVCDYLTRIKASGSVMAAFGTLGRPRGF